MFSTKSSLMMAILAVFVCVSSTVQAADLYSPGNPLNCTAWTQNCQTLSDSIYGNGKNASYTSISATCTNETTLSGAMDLCNDKVTCLATFMLMSNAVVMAAEPSASAAPTAASSAAAATTSGASSSAPAATGTTPSGPAPTGPVYSVGSVNLTSQLLAMYDTSKCGKSAAAAKMVTSAAAAALVASVITLMTYAL
ncbi:hypothetical protein EMPS_01939 [Entomortierella parvispora]|uniref:Uncharacterized protein n=1 Tax=Entomortierella parvispora TaxID=205924 RepID=A0A9P3LTA0_9FUNG|nr:hypothetical protein EMPS_01939 [Entomortierella parvispora]